jgi:hypothetical protein
VTVDVDLGGYMAGGYWLVRPAARPAWCDPRYVADPLVSCSGCLLRRGVGPSKDGWCVFEESAADLGVSAEHVADARAWVVEHDAMVGPEHTWSSPAPLLEFVERFIADGSVTVLGVALPTEQARGWDSYGWGGPIAQLLAQGAPLAPGGVPLGWEPVECHAHAVMCSWTCNSLQEQVAEQIELRLNGDGLVPDQAHADEVMRIVDTLDKEIGPWAAFLLVRYGPEPRGPFRMLVEDACEMSLDDLEGLGLPPALLDRGADVPFEFPAGIPWPPSDAM